MCVCNVMLGMWWIFNLRMKQRKIGILQIMCRLHDQNVVHDQKIWIIEKFGQKIDFGENNVFG